MTREETEALEERVCEFGNLARMVNLLGAVPDIDVDANAALYTIALHLDHLTDKLAAMTVPVRASQEGST